MSIIVSKKGQPAQKLDKSGFEKEDYLQNYIHENPESIPVYEIQEDKRLFVMAREFPTESGPIDALAIDKDGDIYVVETKLYKNPDKRTVVAQALDYGASMWKHMNDFDEFVSILDADVRDKFGMGLEEKIKSFFAIDDEQSKLVLDAMRMNLREGKIKFVVLMDSMDERLKDLIIYVNQNSQFDIYAVQLEYYKFQEYEIMIPKMFGVEVKKSIKSSSSVGQRRKWNEQDFILQSKERLKGDSKKVTDLYLFFKERADRINWGTGNLNGSFAPVFFKIHKNIAVFSVYSDGEIMIKFNWLKDSLEEAELTKYVELFLGEVKKGTDIEISKGDLLKSEVKISSNDFIKNYAGLKNAIDAVVKS
jgi:hypothetical protein